MPRTWKPLLVTLVSASLSLATPLAGAEPAGQAASMPSPIEREFWDATRQIDSVAAYQAYLARFPNGFYALLASAAIKKAGSPAPGPNQTRSKLAEEHRDAPSAVANGQFFPARIAGPVNSGAVSQQVGDVFRGPGSLTVGWMGAKKQIVVPNGDWVLLAAEDSISAATTPMGSLTTFMSTSITPPATVTTLVLAKLEGSIVSSFLVARFNSREAHPRHTWADAMTCGASSPSVAFVWRDRGFFTTQCIEATLHSPLNVAKTFSGTIWEESLKKLSTGGGALPSAAHLVTDMYYTGDSSSYLKISRIDFGVSAGQDGSGSSDTAPDLSIRGREKWARAYSELAVMGYRKQLAEGDLKPGGSPATDMESLPN